MRTNSNNVIFSRFLGICFLLILAAGIVLFSPVARAAPLNLNLYDYPDFTFDQTDISYDAATNVFTAVGNAGLYLDGVHGNPPGVECGIYVADNFVIKAKIDENGALDLSPDPDPWMNTVHITGTAYDINNGYAVYFPGPDLLIGDLVDFGFPEPANGSADTLEFLFDVTGGDAASAFLAVYYQGGIKLSFGGLPTGDPWATPWSASSGIGDVAPAPIPGAIWLLGSGFIGLVGFRKRFRKA